MTGACLQMSAEQMLLLEANVLEAEQIMRNPPAKLNVMQLLDLDYGFHRLIAEGSGNRWLVTLLDQVFDKMMLLRMQTTRQNPEVLEIRIEHGQIYQAIAHRQTEAALVALQEHLLASKERVVGELQQMQLV